MIAVLLSLSLPLLSCTTPAPAWAEGTEERGEVVEAAVSAAEGPAVEGADYVLHEWGTFTTVSDAAGRPVVWAPLEVLSDLPSFVYASKMVGKGGRATVRMETPVIYLYSDQPQTVSIGVRFPHGSMTEWYPAEVSGDMGGLSWPKVEIGAVGVGEPPNDGRESHYYPARQAGADRLRVGEEVEDFLFYRGIGHFDPTLRLRVEGARIVGQRARDGAAPDRRALVFYREGERAGLRVWDAGAGEGAGEGTEQGAGVAIPALEMSAAAAAAATKQELRAMLLGAGLYAAEAEAMLATWEGDWFEPGLRVMWLYTDAEVDALLPLTATPPPKEQTRVLVGRTELFTEAMQASVAAILADVVAGKRSQASAETTILAKYGRFAEPIRLVAASRLPKEDQQRLIRLGILHDRQGFGHLQ